MPKFWNWIARSADTENRAVLVLSGAIDSGESWYGDGVWPARFREELNAHAGEDIQVEINSPGGDVFAGFEIYNMLISHNASVRVRVVGMAASAASIVAMAADKGQLIMTEASLMMIHNPWTLAMGDSEELREQADVLDMIRDVMCSVYMHRFSGEESELTRLLDEESWLSPARAMELGLCDEIEIPDDRDTAPAAAAMAGRYAAMIRAQMTEIRERFGAKKPPEKAPAGKPAPDAKALLAEADALIGASMMEM